MFTGIGDFLGSRKLGYCGLFYIFQEIITEVTWLLNKGC